MSTSKKTPEDKPPSNIRWADPIKAMEVIDDLIATSDHDDDTSEWETLKKLLDEDRLSDRKFFPNG